MGGKKRKERKASLPLFKELRTLEDEGESGSLGKKCSGYKVL